MKETLLPLSKPLTVEMMGQVELFRSRFQELWDNWQSLKKLGLKLGGSFQNKGGGVVSGPGCGVEHHRLKGLYLDYRFFHAVKEPTNYFRVANLISRNCEDRRLRAYMERDKDAWKSAGMLADWHGFTADNLIDSLFNGRFFHSAQDTTLKMEDLRRAMSDELANHELAYCIRSRMLLIRNLNWVVAPLSLETQFVRIPE